MATETITGKAIVFGIPGSGITITGVASFLLQDGALERKFEMETVKDERKFDASWIGVNDHYEESITFTPTGTSRANAQSNASDAIKNLTPFKKVTISGMAIDELNGDWGHVGDAKINLSHAPGKMQFRVRRYIDADQNAAFLTEVS